MVRLVAVVLVGAGLLAERLVAGLGLASWLVAAVSIS